MAASPDPVIGAGLAFISHFVVDYIGESSIGTTKESAAIEASLLLLYIVGAWATGAFWICMIGWVMANLPDLIDKPRRIIFGKQEWFSCHNGLGLFQYKGRKLGYPIQFKITKEQTILSNISATIVWFLACIILR